MRLLFKGMMQVKQDDLKCKLRLPWWSGGWGCACQYRGHVLPCLVLEDPTCQGAREPRSHNSWILHVREPVLGKTRCHLLRSPHTTSSSPCWPRLEKALSSNRDSGMAHKKEINLNHKVPSAPHVTWKSAHWPEWGTNKLFPVSWIKNAMSRCFCNSSVLWHSLLMPFPVFHLHEITFLPWFFFRWRAACYVPYERGPSAKASCS